MPYDRRKIHPGTGVMPRSETGNVLNVPLSDPRIAAAGIDPKTLYGRGITEEELQARLKRQNKGKRK